jgi:hypothetical protein
MTFYPLIFSIIFFAVCIISLILGIYVLQSNPKGLINRCFFVLIVAVNIWSIGLALATPAADAETSGIWRRVAAIGWSTVYGIVLHYILIITGRNALLKKWWFYVFLYLPAFVNILAFSIPSGICKVPFQLTARNSDGST